MRKVRFYFFPILLLFFAFQGKAQLSLRLPNGVRPAVEKVLGSFSNNFSSIQGDTLSVTSNSTVFNSTVKPEGAIECTLTKFWTNTQPDYSWQAIMLQTDDFDVAVKKYSTCYQQLKNTTIRLGSGNCKMEGEYEAPGDTKNEDKNPDAASAPKSTSSDDDIEEVVFVLQKDNTVKKVKVKTGIQDLNNIEILEGLKEGDEVITGPYSIVSKTLKDGNLVQVVAKDKLFEDKKKD